MTLFDEPEDSFETESVLALIDWLGDHVPRLVQSYQNKITPELQQHLLEYMTANFGIAAMHVEDGVLTIKLKNGIEQRFDGLRGKTGTSIIGADIDDDDLYLTFETPDGEIERKSVGRTVGRHGRGVEKTEILEDGQLRLIYDDGTEEHLGNVRGRDGSRIEYVGLEDKSLQIVFRESDGTEVIHSVGPVVGRDGADGLDGADGKDGKPGNRGSAGKKGEPGRSVTQAFVDLRGHLILNYDDGQTQDTGLVQGNFVRARISDLGDLKLILATGEELNAGPVRAADGRDGPGFLWRGPYSDQLTYYGQMDNPDGPYADVVEYWGSTYIATGKTISAPPGGTWDLVAAKGETQQHMLYAGGGGGGGGTTGGGASGDPSDFNPLPPAIAPNPGNSHLYSRSDHVHEYQESPFYVSSDPIPVLTIRRITTTQYAALSPPDPNTLYAVVPG